MKRTVNLRDMSAINNTPSPIPHQEIQTRKILLDLQKEKSRLRSMHQGGGPNANSIRLPMNQPMPSPTLDTPQHIGMTQRSALQMAHASSFGYFIPQDSAFGNVILPVIPRISPKPE